MCSVLSATSTWLDSHQYLAIWLEGIALLAIFIWDRWDSHQQHKQTLAQMTIMQNQARATETAAHAASKSAEALISSERAWVIAELIPQAARASDNQWYRFVGDMRVHMGVEEILAGHHLRYKLKLTNMGRTPAQIFGITLIYTCLGEGIADLRSMGERGAKSYHSVEHLLGGNGQTIEIEELIDVGNYMQDDRDSIDQLKKTAVIRGRVKYRHIFSTTDDCFSEFCYVYTVSEERLNSVGRHTKQRQEKVEE